MEKLEWTDRLSVGVESIDGQHKQWIAHYNNVIDALESPDGPMHVTNTLGFLIDYTETHFEAEQKSMLDAGYPEYEAHKAKHDELKKTLADLVQEYEEEGPTHILTESVDVFLGNWLIKHIEDVDMRFGAYVEEKGIDSSEQA